MHKRKGDCDMIGCPICNETSAPKPTKGSRLTKWERGQVLVKAADALADCAVDLKNYKEERDFIRFLRKQLSNYFTNKEYDNEMGFGL